MSEAVTMAIAEPLKTAGTSAASSLSRMDANKINTIEKPTAPPMPKNNDSKKLWLDCALSSGMPSTAQLVVINGKKIPNA